LNKTGEFSAPDKGHCRRAEVPEALT
jgi:hypothetical protein